MNYLKKICLCISALMLSFVIAYLLIPARYSAPILLEINRMSAGLSSGKLDTPSGDIHYLAGGEGETIIFLHGVYARKEHWIELAKKLKQNYRVIILDLPGFGENAALPKGGYNLSTQAEALHSIIEKLELDDYHIAANSMGAQIAGLYIEEHPDHVTTFSLIGSPLGVKTPQSSDMDLALKAGHRPLVVSNKADFEARNDWLFPKTPFLPRPILKQWAKEEISNAKLNDRIWKESQDLSAVSSLEDLADSFPMPVFVLWCYQDKIFHVSGADLLDEKIENSTVVRAKKCGHVPMLDNPEETYKHYYSFLKAQH